MKEKNKRLFYDKCNLSVQRLSESRSADRLHLS